jgi:ribosome modulation factor
VTHQQFERIKSAGASCARNGGKPDQCPYRQGSSLYAERDAWMAGYSEGLAERRRGVR